MALAQVPVIAQAKKLRHKLLECANELRIHGMLAKSEVGKALADIDANSCEEAAAMLQKLGTEVQRLRLGIGHFRYGHMDKAQLDKMTENWNGDDALLEEESRRG